MDYTPAGRHLVYESVSRGVKSGGFTAHNTVSAPQVDPVQAGKAHRLRGRRQVRRDPDVAHRHGRVLLPLPGSADSRQIYDAVYGIPISAEFVNAEFAISGGELELEWRPLPGLSISQYYGFAEGYYTSTCS
jgi:iron complex outermembrane receptor protein